jgi:glycosyltransferase involved in cell wall biosynthesis/2-polyprenyl-3-methyl-5-hydroxy-6-metoxy-1,4-benzoquinol methylase
MTLPVENIPCPLCQESESRVIHSHIDRIDTPGTQVVRCTHCGLVYLTPRLKNLYDNYTLSDEYLHKFYLPDQQRRGLLTLDGCIDHARNRVIHARWLDEIKPYRLHNRVLDIGCAIGLFLEAVRHEGWQAFGVEPSRALGEYGSQRFGLDIFQGELHERVFPDDYFDVVTLWEVLEHLHDPMNTLREACRVLRPGGLLLLSTPNWHSLGQDLLQDDWDNLVTDHFQFFTQDTLRQMLQAAGLKPQRTGTEGVNYHELCTKLGQRAAQSAQRQVESRKDIDLGSTLWGIAEKPGAAPGTHPTVYFISGCNIGTTSEYRVLHKQEQLATQGLHSLARQQGPEHKITLQEALTYDVLYLYRVAYDPSIEELIDQARARRIPVVFDTDDLVFEPEMATSVDALATMPSDQAALYYEGVWRYRRTLLACDAVVTSTGPLAELARALGKPTFIHRNALSGEFIRLAEPLSVQRKTRAAASRIILGYVSGTATHNKDFAEASAALAQVLERHPQVELHILGPLVVLPELARFGERVRHLPLVDWTQVPKTLATFDINLAPLERHNIFCRCKSEVKYIEAAVLGIPTLASRIDPFEFAIRDGETGLLAGDTQEWIEKLERLLSDPVLRSRLGEAARTDVLARYSPPVRGQELVQTLQAIEELGRERPGSVSVEKSAEGEGQEVLQASKRPLVLNWVFTEPIPGSGGHIDTIRMINLLAGLGHQNNIYVTPDQRLRNKSDLEIRDYIRRHFADPQGNVFKWADGLLSESDAVILTFWSTPYRLGDTRSARQVFYFVQDWEPFFYPMSANYLGAERTYTMGFPCITLGRWLARHLRERYHADTNYFDLAVDHTIYYPRPMSQPDRPRVCFYARPSTPRRLFKIGTAALSQVSQHRPDVEFVLYGASDADLAQYDLPFAYTNRGILNEHQLAELFSSSTVGIVFSPTNCSLVSPEMMACRCAVVDLNRETVEGVLEHEVNALLAEPTPEAIAEAILRLLDDKSLRLRLVEAAYQQAQNLSWEKSARQVEAILYGKLSALPRPAWPRLRVQSDMPALSDLPTRQQQLLNRIHDERKRSNRAWPAAAREWAKRLLQVDQALLFNDSPAEWVGEIRGKRRIGQSFVARHDHLYRIDVLVATYGRRNTRDVILHLMASPDAASDLATVRVNASQLADSGYASFVFPPLADSRSKTYYFCLESPESVSGDAISVWAYRHADLQDAALDVNRRRRKGHLVFGVFYQDDQWGQVGERPLRQYLQHATTHWDRLMKAQHLLFTRGLPGLMQEIKSYRRWKSIQRRNST